MRSDRERLALMHVRANELRRKAAWQALRFWGGCSAALALCLISLAAALNHGHGISSATSTGASLLSDSVGGYVLVAVLAFMLGMVVTVILKSRDDRKRSYDAEARRSDKEDKE